MKMLILFLALIFSSWASAVDCESIPAPSAKLTPKTFKEIAIPSGETLTSFARFTAGIYDRDWIFLTSSSGFRVLKENGGKLLSAQEGFNLDPNGPNDREPALTQLELFQGPMGMSLVSFTGVSGWALQLSYINAKAAMGGAGQGSVGTIIKDPLIRVMDQAGIWDGDSKGSWWPYYAYMLADGRIFYQGYFAETSLQNALGIEPVYARQTKVLAYSADQLVEAELAWTNRTPFKVTACYKFQDFKFDKMIATNRYPFLISIENGQVLVSEFSDWTKSIDERWLLSNKADRILDAKWIDGRVNLMVQREGAYYLLIEE